MFHLLDAGSRNFLEFPIGADPELRMDVVLENDLRNREMISALAEIAGSQGEAKKKKNHHLGNSEDGVDQSEFDSLDT